MYFNIEIVNIYIQIINKIQTLKIYMSHMRSHDQFPKKERFMKFVALYHSFPNVFELSFRVHFSLRYKVKHMQICKKRPIFSVFCVFLNEEWSLSHYFDMFVKVIEGSTYFVNEPKTDTRILTPWEIFPKRKYCTNRSSMMLHSCM